MTQDHDNGRTLAPWQQAEAEFGCEHSERALRVKTLSNGAVQYRRQCLKCGAGGLAIKKDVAALEMRLSEIQPFDDNLEASFYARQRERADEIRNGQRIERSEAWFAEHDAYTQTSMWFSRRDRVMARDSYRCQADLPGCTRRAQQVHHLNYDHWKNEPLYDLIALCNFCHGEITTMDRARRGAVA